MTFSDAAQTYTLLTVGDGLVSQVPALIISTAAGIVVSRAGSDSNLGLDIGTQLLMRPRAMGVASAILFLFGLNSGASHRSLFDPGRFGRRRVSYLVFQTEKDRQTASDTRENPRVRR